MCTPKLWVKRSPARPAPKELTKLDDFLTLHDFRMTIPDFRLRYAHSASISYALSSLSRGGMGETV